MSERYRRIRKRMLEIYGRPVRVGSQKSITYSMKDKFTEKFIAKKETLMDFKIEKKIDNWERIKEQLELGHLEIMDERLKQTILKGAIDKKGNKAELIRPIIILKVDCYDDEGNFIETREILAYDKQKEGNWLDLKSEQVDDSIYDQIIEIDDRVNELEEKYDYQYSIIGASVYYGFFYGA